jgi:hypothetical protein
MSFFSSAEKVINIISWFTDKYDKIKDYVKKKIKAVRARRIRNAVDQHNTSFIGERVRRIIKKRQDRSDSS